MIVRDGQLLEAALRLERLPPSELLEAARQHGIDDLADIRYAVLEPNGKISIIPAHG